MDRGQQNTLLICTFDPDYELSSVLQEAKRKVERMEQRKHSASLTMQVTSSEARQHVEIHSKHTRVVRQNAQLVIIISIIVVES